MKTYNYITLILGLTAAFSCTNKIGSDLPVYQSPEDLVTIKAEFASEGQEPLTKVGANVGFSWSWSEGDKISVTSSSDTKDFIISAGAGTKNAEFKGKAVEGDGPYTIQFPANEAESASFASQTQEGNDNVGHLKYCAELSGVDAYESFAFSDAWASQHGGTFKQTGLLKIIMDLPDTVKNVSKVTVAAENNVFYSGNGDTKTKKLELELTNAAPDSKHTFVAWMTTSWNEATVKTGEFLTVSVKIGEKSIERSMEFQKDGTLMAGKVNVFEIDGSAWTYGSHYTEGKGTESSPWVIYTLDELLCMRDDLVEGGIRYFKLGADIDMTGVDWTPLNSTGTYDKKIYFDGDGHTLSNFYTTSAADYPSFFGVLYGTCKNVKFVNAEVNTPDRFYTGILGGRGGYTDKPCVVENVHVQGKITASKYAAGFFGIATNCTIERCSADVTIISVQQMCGGLVGADAGGLLTIRNCYTSGLVQSDASICGGIVGDLTYTGSSIYNSYSTATVRTQFIFGGIVGRANAGAKTSKANCNKNTPGNHIENCIAWNDAIESYKEKVDAGEHYSSGAIIGGTATRNYLVNCIRKSDLNFTECPYNQNLGEPYALFDQENADPNHPLVQGSGTYASAYHGKAAASGETLSDVAKRLGWDENIWDLSNAIPALK